MSSRKKMGGFSSLQNVNKSLEILNKHLSKIEIKTEKVPIHDSCGRIASKDIKATHNIPPFNRSAVEGYAVISLDTNGATPTDPKELEIIGTAEAGVEPKDIPKVSKRKTVEIYTGAPIPTGSDAVVMVEYTKRKGDSVLIHNPVTPWKNISKKGEDFLKGKTIIYKGTRIKPWHIGALASMNIQSAPVYRKLKIGILSTGNEIRELGEKVKPGEIINSSRPMLISLVEERHCLPINLGNVPDEEEKILEKLLISLTKCDIVITTGGTSLGMKDLIPEIIGKAGTPGLLVHGVAMRPAKPTGFGVIGKKPIFMLSGYPVSALIGFEVFVDTAINTILGTPEEPKVMIKGKLTRKLATHIGSKSFIRVKIIRENNGYIIEPLRLTGSGLLSSITKANGILEVDEDIEGYDEGDEVNVRVLQSPDITV